ncbi:toll-like receptor 4 [Mytilus galloprovincialis]|uniref:toll-like receptor 4 n=1 Tax=Mytilus galloprovincialis TaxID=29158 RepID=UPI003F7B8BD0
MRIFIDLCIISIYLCKTVFSKCNITLDILGHKEANCKDQGLTTVLIHLARDINKLDLSYNKLTRLDANIFLRYKYLEQLMLDNNAISLLHKKAFNGLSLLSYLSMSNNNLNLSESYPTEVFESLTNLSVLDISRNMKTREFNPYRIPFSEIGNLRELSIDLVFNATFGQEFKKLINLQTLRFDYCHVNFLYNGTFSEMPVHIKEFHMTTCKDFVVVEIGVLVPFPRLKVLNITNSNVHLTQALRILHPFQNKSMEAILFRGITYVNFKHGLDSIILTPEMMKFISTICIKSLDLSDNDIILVKNASLVLFQHPQCFENLMMSANSFGLDNWALNFFIFVRKLTNIKIFDFSYVPLMFKNPIFLDVITRANHTRVEEVQRKLTQKILPITVTLPSKTFQFLRITHVMGTMSFREFKLTNSSLRHLELSYFDTKFFPIITVEGFNSLEHLDLSGISSDITIGMGRIPHLIHLKTLILKETNLYNLLQTNTTAFKFCPNIMILDISHNYIWNIKTLGQLHNLRLLNLSHNLLDNVPMVVTKFENIAELDLSHNQFTTIGKKTLDWIHTQHEKIGTFKLFLNDNPFICSCSTTAFLRWILTTKVKLDNNGNYSCWVAVDSRNHINYTKNIAEDFHNYFVNCDPILWIRLGISLLVSVLSSLICITLLYNFRWRIIFFFSEI